MKAEFNLTRSEVAAILIGHVRRQVAADTFAEFDATPCYYGTGDWKINATDEPTQIDADDEPTPETTTAKPSLSTIETAAVPETRL